MNLRERKCEPCHSGTGRLDQATQSLLLPEVQGWRVQDDRLIRELRFPSFVATMAFVNRVAALAEAEQHHPDFCVHYDRVDLTVWTHAFGPRGLSDNDFILAAKINALVEK
jgi:4a-hydroxytetrahydrobiopterin dehydratase